MSVQLVLSCSVSDGDQVSVFVLVTPVTAVAHSVVDPGAGDHSRGLRTVEGLPGTGRGGRLVTAVKTVAVIIIHQPEGNPLRLVETCEHALAVSLVE